LNATLNEQELDSAVGVGRKLRREYHSTRQDAEGMLQVGDHTMLAVRTCGLSSGVVDDVTADWVEPSLVWHLSVPFVANA
jgi:hypothetical protein